MKSHSPEPEHHQIRTKLGPEATLLIWIMSDGSEASEDEQESWGYGLHLGCGDDPKDPSSDWPLHKLVMPPEVTNIF
jgi:hypothetical protein